MNNNGTLLELIKYQRKDIPYEKKLLYNDIKRLNKYINNSIFNQECSLWNGNVSTVKNNNYINFFLNRKKIALHRILYFNYIGDILDSEYIKFNCQNKGLCCNINHFYKIDKINLKVIFQKFEILIF